MSETWQMKVGLWLARHGGWAPPAPRTIVQPDPAVVAEREGWHGETLECLPQVKAAIKAAKGEV